MTEAQNILEWIKSEGITDSELSSYLGISRETIVRIRGAKGRCTGASILSDLRKIATKGGMPNYHTPVSRSQIKQTPITQQRTPTPKIQAPRPQTQMKSLPTYQVGKTFNCYKCHFPNTARATNSYCVNCEAPYRPYY